MSKLAKTEYTSEARPGFTHRTAMEEAARCLLCHEAPCDAGCPAGTAPSRFIRSIRFRNAKGAAETIRENNILGGSCARICPYDKLCEEACSRSGIDRPIEIGKLQRYAMEQERIFKSKTLKAPAAMKTARVACVGAGPASLACAATLAAAGYRVTIFEAEEEAGGMLRYGVPPARLPREVIEQDLDAVRGLGVEFVFNTKIGEAASVEELQARGFAAVFIGAGLWNAKLPDMEGTGLEGVWAAVDFLKKAASTGGDTGLAGKRVVVIGGGDVAMDCAVTAKQTGAASVAIYYRRTLEEAPANADELRYAFSLGIPIMTDFAPARLVGDDGRLTAVEFRGRDGRSSAFVVADAVVFATGQSPDDTARRAGLRLTEKGMIATDAGGKTSVPGIFAAGDAVNGGKTAVEAVAEGKTAAAEMIAWLEEPGRDGADPRQSAKEVR
ncbi:MAG: FAD-dependent oxidoreductase [Clostridiales Family XIII bacterium]|nr:FAD-dependent oxidoreductase [Clostridiales Family XIII bacterium]